MKIRISVATLSCWFVVLSTLTTSSHSQSLPTFTKDSKEWLLPSALKGMSYDQIQWTLWSNRFRLATRSELEALIGLHGTQANLFIESVSAQIDLVPCMAWGRLFEAGFAGAYDNKEDGSVRNIGYAGLVRDGTVGFSPDGAIADAGASPFLPDSGCGVVWAIKASPIICPNPQSNSDFDCDGKEDRVIWRQESGNWFIRRSRIRDVLVVQWGLPGDFPFVGQYNNDGIPDLVVWRPSTGTWFLLSGAEMISGATGTSWQWGLPGDLPLSKDHDGDGLKDFTIYRPSLGMHYWLRSDGVRPYFGQDQWGLGGDLPR